MIAGEKLLFCTLHAESKIIKKIAQLRSVSVQYIHKHMATKCVKSAVACDQMTRLINESQDKPLL